MLKHTALISVLIVLSNCASSELSYAPASEPESAGYSEQQIAENRYRVIFTGNGNSTMETVQNYALLRAAELTVQKDYDYFRVADRNTVTLNDERPETSTVVSSGTHTQTNCGLLGCQTRHTPSFSATQIQRAPDNGRYSSNLEIVMSEEGPSTAADTYDAREVIENIRSNI